MSLKRSGAGLTLVMLVAWTLVLLGTQAIAIVHLIAAAKWDGPLLPFAVMTGPLLLVLVGFDVLLPSAAVGVFLRWRMLAAVAGGDLAGAPPAPKQPDPQLALAYGEQLILARRKQPGGCGRSLGLAFSVLLLMVLSELGVLALLPALDPLYPILAPYGSPNPPVPGSLDWLCAAIPVAVFALLLVSLVASSLRNRWRRVIADDAGIAVEAPLHRRKFIPWNDILIVLRPFISQTATPAGGYTLWGRDHLLVVSIDRRRQSGREIRGETGGGYDYEGGYDAYLERAQRLLATIVARCGTPVRVSTRASGMLRFIRRRFPQAAVQVEDALAAPLATTALRPEQSVVAMHPRLTQVRLRQRLPALPVAGETLIWTLALAIAVFACIGPLSFETFSPMKAFSGDRMTLLVLLIVSPLVVLMGCGFALMRRFQRRPEVVADPAGLTVRTGSSQTTKAIPWQEVRAWVVVSGQFGAKRPTTYIVFSDSQKLTWTEPEDAELGGRGVRGDRRAAYRERAEQLHAFIEARTGLPLRELRMDT